MTDRIEIKAQLTAEPDGTVSGIAWPFKSEDRVGDIITKGAFSNTTGPIPILFGHDHMQPIGVWHEVRETAEGLSVKGRLFHEDVARAREVRALVRGGALSGLSIGFVAKAATPRQRGRTITALDLHEISIVAVPAHPGARITSAKADNPAGSPADTHAKGNPVEPEVQTETPAVVPAPAVANAPAIDTKALDKIVARLDAIEAKAARPGIVGAPAIVLGGDEKKAFTEYLRTGDATELKALAVNTGTGGILAPETVSSTIVEKIAEFSPVRSVAQTITMSGPLLQLPRLVTEVTVAGVAELAPKPESEPTFEQIDVKPHEMAVIVPVSRTLIEDAQVDLTSYLTNHLARRFGQLEASWFVNGNGTTQAQGALVSAEVQDLEVGTFNANALIDLFYSLPSAYSARGAWLMSRGTMAAVRKLTDSTGAYLWQPALAAGQPPTILGRPVLEAVDMPGVAAGASPVIFGDFAAGYLIADRVSFEVIRDELTGAANGIIKLVARRRVGGRVILGEALSKLSMAA